MAALNYHHLRYFWAIAQQRSLTKAAQQLHVSQSGNWRSAWARPCSSDATGSWY